MKKLIMSAVFVLSLAAFTTAANAQLRVQINIGSQPAWGPVGYDYVRYYYLPEINAYYDVYREQYIIQERRGWTYTSSLPRTYGRINLYNTYKVVVNRDNPFDYNRQDIARYGKYSKTYNQTSIRDSRDWKYYENRNHPKHNEWVKQNNRNNDNRRNNDMGRDNGRNNSRRY